MLATIFESLASVWHYRSFSMREEHVAGGPLACFIRANCFANKIQ